ncbi:MAG: cytochrome c [Planctomycetes bacterium]|nr:cytochrome c [Planctomycetota bacterium]
MKKVPTLVRAAMAFVILYGFFAFGIAPVTKALVGTAAPLPSSLVLMYSGMSAAAILLYVSLREERWRDFFRPVVRFLRDDEPPTRAKRFARAAVLVLLPPAAGAWAYARASAPPEPPADPPGIHFNLPDKYAAVENPLPWTEDNVREGGILYTRNCAMCHGDAQDGNGLFARAWQPRPANFRDTGTIAQLDENYLFWRIKEGGPGLPKGSIEHRSAMPVWDGVLTDDEIWKIIMFEYTSAGVKPAKRK